MRLGSFVVILGEQPAFRDSLCRDEADREALPGEVSVVEEPDAPEEIATIAT